MSSGVGTAIVKHESYPYPRVVANGGSFTYTDVGRTITISESANPYNNGTFTIIAVHPYEENSVWYSNLYGSTEWGWTGLWEVDQNFKYPPVYLAVGKEGKKLFTSNGVPGPWDTYPAPYNLTVTAIGAISRRFIAVACSYIVYVYTSLKPEWTELFAYPNHIWTSIYGISSSDIWFSETGQYNDSSGVWHWDGSSLTQSLLVTGQSEIYTIRGSGSSNIWAFGTIWSPTPVPTAWRYNGSSWSVFGELPKNKGSLEVKSSSLAYHTCYEDSEAGHLTIYKFDGTSWYRDYYSLGSNPNTISKDVCSIETNYTVSVGRFFNGVSCLLWNGISWSDISPIGIGGLKLNSVSAKSTTDIVAVGTTGISYFIVRYNGSSWSKEEPYGTSYFIGTEATDVAYVSDIVTRYLAFCLDTVIGVTKYLAFCLDTVIEVTKYLAFCLNVVIELPFEETTNTFRPPVSSGKVVSIGNKSVVPSNVKPAVESKAPQLTTPKTAVEGKAPQLVTSKAPVSNTIGVQTKNLSTIQAAIGTRYAIAPSPSLPPSSATPYDTYIQSPLQFSDVSDLALTTEDVSIDNDLKSSTFLHEKGIPLNLVGSSISRMIFEPLDFGTEIFMASKITDSASLSINNILIREENITFSMTEDNKLIVNVPYINIKTGNSASSVLSVSRQGTDI